MRRAILAVGLAFATPALLAGSLELVGLGHQAGVGSNLIVGSIYYGIAGVVATGLYMRGMAVQRNLLTRLFAVLFFIGCGSHHFGVAAHDGVLDLGEMHHLTFMLWQVIGGMGFLILASGSSRGFYFGWGEKRSPGLQELRSGDARVIDLLAQGGFINDVRAAREHVRAAIRAERGGS